MKCAFLSRRSPLLWGLMLLAIAALVLTSPAAFAQISCGPKPPAPPKRISGGEAFPPLPLPATPLRRTERKRPPAAPTLMAKINLGSRQVLHGQKMVWDWTTPAGDTQDLFKHMRRVMNLKYKADVVRMDQFSYTPEAIPIVYLTSWSSFQFTDKERAALRRYILAGGALLGAAGSGSPEFSESFAKEARKMFPDRPWHVLPLDHPIYKSHYGIGKVQYRKGASELTTAAPHLEGLNIGTRAAIILCRADLSCGWNNHTHPEGFRVMPKDATKLGTNIVSYLLAYYRLGRVNSTPVMFRTADGVPGDVQVGQIVHNGDWDPCPSSLQYLLKEVSEETSAHVNYRQVPVDLETADLFQYPFLYLTGLLDFQLSKKSAANLRQYLTRGGFLLVSNGCNRQEFDRAVRRELGRVLGGNRLQALPSAHPIFSSHYDLMAKSGAEKLEGVTLDDVTCVVYSPGSIGTAWDGEPRPFVELPDTDTARRLGLNTLVYAMTH